MTIVEIVLKLAGFAFNYMGNKKKNKQWLAKVSETIRKKGWVRQEFVLKLEADRDKYINEQIKKDEALKAKDSPTTNQEANKT